MAILEVKIFLKALTALRYSKIFLLTLRWAR